MHASVRFVSVGIGNYCCYSSNLIVAHAVHPTGRGDYPGNHKGCVQVRKLPNTVLSSVDIGAAVSGQSPAQLGSTSACMHAANDVSGCHLSILRMCFSVVSPHSRALRTCSLVVSLMSNRVAAKGPMHESANMSAVSYSQQATALRSHSTVFESRLNVLSTNATASTTDAPAVAAQARRIAHVMRSTAPAAVRLTSC